MFGSNGEPARRPAIARVFEQTAFGSDFEVGGAFFGEDVAPKATQRAPLPAPGES